MSTFIAQQIMKQADISEEKGKAKYRAYFVKTSLYVKWQEEVNSILEIDGYGYCIVEE